MPKWREDPAKVRPMLATLSEPPLQAAGLVYEPKYDGIRALVHVPPKGDARGIRIWSRLGNEKTMQFPSIVSVLEPLRAKLRGPVLIDGEIVALDEQGRPAGFQRLQGRIHLTGSHDVDESDRRQPVAFIAFDLLRDGDDDLRGLPLTERRTGLEQRLAKHTSSALRLSEQAAGDGRALHERALREGWEGLIAKEARAPYQSGRRSPVWRKFKLVHQQEFVVGGWTEPRQTRQYFGALLLGVKDDSGLRYVGHTGTGFNEAELKRVSALLKAREIDRSPFTTRIKTNEPAHWVRPELVAEVRFTEWTADQKLRHPVYLGLRDDKKASQVVREFPIRLASARGPRDAPGSPTRSAALGWRSESSSAGARASGSPELRRASGASRAAAPGGGAPGAVSNSGAPRAVRKDAARKSNPVAANTAILDQLRALEDARRDGAIELPGGERLKVTNLAKVFWPGPKFTKGDLLRYYTEVSPFLLPAVADRPLVMKRFPNGINSPAFYQQRTRDEKPPAGVRIETLPFDPIKEPDSRRLVGGSLITLLYMTQIAAISQDPWFSRVQSPRAADYVALDLDPGEGTPFARVLDVARWLRDELESLKVPAVPKTSGSSGLHIYIPLPADTSYESGLLFCQILATIVASRHPKVATVERTVRRRGRGTVYVDYLQNILGKTLATAYSARASEFAGVSIPLTWKELDEDVDPRDFTIATAPARFRQVGDLWSRLRTSKPANLETVFRKYAK
jgi:bifunctional non-homologous end joining protein LigD